MTERASLRLTRYLAEQTSIKTISIYMVSSAMLLPFVSRNLRSIHRAKEDKLMAGSNSQTHTPSDVPLNKRLTSKSAEILKLLAAGYSPDDIVLINPEIARGDISQAAEEALGLHTSAQVKDERAERIVRSYPRAFEKWTTEEEERAAQLFNSGKTMREIAADIQRQPNAVKIRLQKMGLFHFNDMIQ